MSFSLSYSIFNFSSPSLYSASLSMYVPFLFFHLSKVILLKISVAPAILSRHITKRLFSSVNILRTRSPSLSSGLLPIVQACPGLICLPSEIFLSASLSDRWNKIMCPLVCTSFFVFVVFIIDHGERFVNTFLWFF